MFEQDYTRANDRIHPRKDLLQELEAKWAAEEAQQPAEEGKVLAFPTWAKYVSMAAGILLCVGLGMGSVMLFGRGRQHKAAAAPMAAEASVAQEEATILTESYELVTAGDGMLLGASAAHMEAEPPRGTHPAADEAEVEDALWFRAWDQGEPAEDQAADLEVPAQAKAAGASVDEAAAEDFAPGEILLRDDLMAVFMPTTQQVRILRYADRKLTHVFSLTLRDRSAQVRRIFWGGNELLAVRERNGDTTLLRFDVSDWKAPRHLNDLTQSGTFLWAQEVAGRIYVLSRYTASEEEPRPWVNGARLDYADVLLDEDRPGDTFAVLTVYDPGQGNGFADQKALLAPVQGAAASAQGLLLWAGEAGADLYAFDGAEGLALRAETVLEGAVRAALAREEGFSLLLETGADAALVTLDGALAETGRATAKAPGAIRSARLDEDGALFLTEDALHRLTPAGDAAAAVAGDAFRRIDGDKALVISAEGRLALVALGEAPEVKGTLEVKDSLSLLIEDPSRMDFDPATGRLIFPAGQKIYQYLINDEGAFTVRGVPLIYYDHNETEQRELRCLLREDRALVFQKNGVALCSGTLERLLTCRY